MVFPDETSLLAQARLASESDHAVAMMIEEIVGKIRLRMRKEKCPSPPGSIVTSGNDSQIFTSRLRRVSEAESWFGVRVMGRNQGSLAFSIVFVLPSVPVEHPK